MILFLLVVALGAPQGPPLSGPVLEQRTQDVAALLRCPVCQGMSIADSPSTVALDMKHQVRDMLAKGYTQEQILAYFERSYGQFVLLKPKFQGVAALVWLLPMAALIFGAIVVVAKAKQLEKRPEKAAEAADDPYLARVREMVEKP